MGGLTNSRLDCLFGTLNTLLLAKSIVDLPIFAIDGRHMAMVLDEVKKFATKISKDNIINKFELVLFIDFLTGAEEPKKNFFRGGGEQPKIFTKQFLKNYPFLFFCVF